MSLVLAIPLGVAASVVYGTSIVVQHRTAQEHADDGQTNAGSLWRLAQKTGTEPDAAALQQVVSRVRQPGWVIDEANHTVTRLTDQPLDLNSIAKGYIIRQAAAGWHHP